MAETGLGLGVVGCGRAWETLHLPAIRRIAGVRVAAVCDTDGQVLDHVWRATDTASRYEAVADLLADPHVDVVAVCTPPATHAEIALAGLEAGKHVFVEKPLTLDPAEAEEMSAAARDASNITATGFNLRCHRLVGQARSLLRAGAVGDVRVIRSAWAAGCGRGRPLPAWRSDPRTGGGVLPELATHHVDLWRHLLDDEVVDVTASGTGRAIEVETVTLSARSLRGVALAGTFSDGVVDGNELEIVGSEGRLSLSLYRGDSLTLVRRDLMHGPAARIRSAARRGQAVMGAALAARGGGDFLDSYRRQWQRLADAARSGGEPTGLASWDDGLAAVRVVDAARRALGSGCRETVARG